ncbi:Uncharacterised protein [Mycobacteroides abscessus subsp. abscessus]|nr:Uncharacterised protein [Mycobacteroides abscessus subsp. abscessus]
MSSRFAATMIDLAFCTPARRSTSDLVALPRTVTKSAAAAASRAIWSSSTTTISDGAAPSESIACTAVFPLVPYPTTTVWLRTRALHRWIFSA